MRAAAAEAIAFVAGDEQVGPLVRIATSSAEEVLVRLSALRSLARMEAPLRVDSIGGTLEEPLLQAAALEVLGYSEDPAVDDVLVKGLSSGNRAIREAAMAALLRRLGRLDGMAADAYRERLREVVSANEQLVPEACARLEGSNLGTRMTLIQFLGLLQDERVAVPILRAGQDEAISELAEATLEALASTFPMAIEGAWETLDAELRRRACSVLGRVGGDVAERLLVDALASQDSELRCAAATALGEGSFTNRLPDLVRRLEASATLDVLDSEDEISAMVRAIVRIAERSEAAEAGIDIRVIEVLSSRLGGASEPVRLAIAQVLAHLGRERDQDVIAYLLKDESPAVRRAAVRALGRFDFMHSREALRLALGDESGAVRTAAAAVIGEFDDHRVVDEFQRLLRDGDSRVTAVALRSAGRFYRRTSGPLDAAYALFGAGLEGDAIVAIASLESLGDVGGEGAASLASSALVRSEPEVVRAAVSCIGLHGPEEGLSDLIARVGHSDWSVRAAVVEVLAERMCRRSVPAMLRRLEVEEDPFVREAILSALRRLEE